MVFQSEKLIKDSGDKIKPEDKKELEEKVEALKKVKDGDNFDEIKKKMEEASKKRADDELKDKLLEIVSKDAQVSLPSSIINREVLSMVDELESNLARQGLNVDSYIKSRKMSLDDLKKELSPAASARVKAKVVLKEIADKEKLAFTEEDFDTEVKALSLESNVPEADLKATFADK